MATLAEIATRAQVSRHTVARILNGQAKENWPSMARRAQRIRKLAAQMGYKPNAAARATVTGRFGSLALLLSTVGYRSNLPADLYTGIDAAAQRHDYRLTVARLPDEVLTDAAQMPRVLRELSSDGLLVNYTSEIQPAMRAAIRGQRVPSVWINSRQDADCVHPDDEQGGRLATEHLLRMGHRRVAYVSFWDKWHYSGHDRRAGYESALRAAGLEPRVVQADVAHVDRLTVVGALLRGRNRPTAIVTTDAEAVLAAALAAGLKLPQDLAVVYFSSGGHSSFARLSWLLQVPEERMGAAAVAMLLGRIADDRGRPADPVAVPYDPPLAPYEEPINPESLDAIALAASVGGRA